jgi:hypothetical protein
METDDPSGATGGPYERADGECTSIRVVRCVSAFTNRTPTDLPPLATVVDPEALDAVVPPTGDGNCCISFRFAGTEVHVSEEGHIRLELEGDPE